MNPLHQQQLKLVKYLEYSSLAKIIFFTTIWMFFSEQLAVNSVRVDGTAEPEITSFFRKNVPRIGPF